MLQMLAWPAGVVFFFIALVSVLARLGWALSGAGKTDLATLEQISGMDRCPRAQLVKHGVLQENRPAEWPREKGRHFRQAPMLDALVQAGTLPPVAQRLPEDPQVMVPFELKGHYGGEWVVYGPGPNEIKNAIGDRNSYNYLLRWSTMGTEVLPNLAYMPTVSDGGRTFTVRIRKGVRWSDGAPFTTDDIMFWYKYVLQDDELSPVKPIELRQGGKLVDVRQIDKYTVQFHFPEPNGLFIQQLGQLPGGQCLIYPAHYLKQFHKAFVSKQKLDEAARAKGFQFWFQYFQDRADFLNPDCPRLWAWVVKEPLQGQTLKLERNPYYWKVDPDGNQLPYLDKMTVYVLDKDTTDMKIMNGEFGLAVQRFRADKYTVLMNNRMRGTAEKYRVFHWPTAMGSGYTISLNQNHPDPTIKQVMRDKRFRYAMSYAINRKEISKICFNGLGTPRQVCPPRTSPFYDPKLESAYVEYSPEKANALLDEMGLKWGKDGVRLDPKGRPFHLQLESQELSAGTQALELVAEYWTAVGIKTDLKVEASQLFYQRKAAAQQDAAAFTGANEQVPPLDPRWFFPYTDESLQGVKYCYWFQSGGKDGEEPPAEIKRCYAIYQQIKQTVDLKEQIRLFQQIQDINRENLWVFGILGDLPDIALVNSHFRNVPPVSVTEWAFRSPGNTVPECFAYVDDNDAAATTVSEGGTK